MTGYSNKINLIREVKNSYNAVLLDIATCVPEKYGLSDKGSMCKTKPGKQ